MNSQVIFKIDKKLKNQAMAKAQEEGIAFATILKLATKSYVAGHLTLGLVGSEEFNAVAGKEIKGALKDIAQGKNLSQAFSSAKEAAKFLKV
jgi:antitoxin component of RelBE/YafQ-DinJ toxin-antitoxin module